MSNEISVSGHEAALIQGDLSKLSEKERQGYYLKTCESLGLNPLTQPFGYISFQGKLKLYAQRNCTDQLRKINGVSVVSIEQKQEGDLLVTKCRMRDKDGREDEDIGALVTKGLQGEALANAAMKCLTKAKRRTTLSLCGLGWLDESEVESVPGMMTVEPSHAPEPPRQLPAPTPVEPAKPKRNGKASVAPQSGAEMVARLKTVEADLVKEGLVAPGELLTHLDDIIDNSPDMEAKSLADCDPKHYEEIRAYLKTYIAGLREKAKENAAVPAA